MLVLLRDAGADLNKATKVILSFLLEGRIHLLFIVALSLIFFFLHAMKDGTTPAHIAAQKEHIEVLALLRDAGADLNKADEVHLPHLENTRNLNKYDYFLFNWRHTLCTHKESQKHGDRYVDKNIS